MTNASTHTPIYGLSLFPGGGGVALGMQQAGITMLPDYEIDDEIAAVARSNGLETLTADMLTAPIPHDVHVDFLHASPPCTSFSQAKTSASETSEDVALAQRTCEYINHFKPKIFTLENVYAFEGSTSCMLIIKTLRRLGYGVALRRVHMESYGIPQTRHRLFILAVRGMGYHEPGLPLVTHVRQDRLPVGELFLSPFRAWNSWHGAIEDLLPGCPPSELAPWQLYRLEPHLRAVLVGAGGYDGTVITSLIDDPAPTVTANRNLGTQLRALLMRSTNAGQEWGTGYRDEGDPAQTVTGDAPGRAVLVGCQTSSNGKRLTMRDAEQPAFTITASQNQGAQLRVMQALLGIRTVQLTTRCLARFQCVPDGYHLPQFTPLACRVIGNMVPPRMMRIISEHLLTKYMSA